MSRYDHIVIGAGIMGSSTALYLVKQGKKVLLLDQYPLPHTRGSSHGQSRVIRSCYSESYFAAMMPDAFAMWKEIEQETDSNLIIQTGSLFMGQSTTPEFSFSLSNMQRHSPQNLILLTTEEVVSRYPMIRYPYDYKVLLDKSGGIVLASKALAAVQNLFKQKGGHLWDGCPVSRIQPGDDVTIMTSRGYVIAPSVVICAGAWTTKLLKSLSVPKPPLQPKAVQVFYWKEKLPGQYSVAGGFPVFVDCTSKTRHAYGLPSLEYPGLVKICVHGGQPCDPDEREKAAPNTEFQNVACEYVREHFPGLESKPSIVENCLYTVTPDECFIIDSLPMVGNIVIGCGFSGTGFKLAPVVGKLLSEVAQGLTPSHDLGPFRLARFTRGAFAEARYRSMTT